MKVETPQILWHEECVRGGKSWAAALSGVSLVESGGSPCSSTTLLSAAAANRKPTLTPSYCLATAGNGSDVHLWRLSFAAASTMTTTTTAATVSSPPSNATAATTNGSSSSNSIPKDEPQQHNNNSGSSSSSITHGEYQHQQQQGAGNSIEPDVATTTTATANGGAIPPVPTAIGDPPSITPPTATNTVTSTNSTGTPPSNASSSLMTKIDFICALTRHDGAVNAVAFSPNGLHLATAGDAGCVIVWSVPPQPGNHNNNNSTTNNNSTNNSHATPGFLSSVATRVQKNDHWCHAVSKESDLAVQIAARTCDGVTDLSWSADSKRLVACTIDHTVLILENVNHPSGTSGATVAAAWEAVYRNPSLHSHLVQGVAYDPTNVYIASQSSDRTVRVLQRKLSSAAVGATISLASSQPKKAVMRPFNGCRSSDGNCNAVPSAEQAAIMAQILTDTKLEVSTKSKQVKFHCSSSNNTIVSGAATGLESASVVASGNDTNLHNDNKINTTNNNNNKQYWYATETTLKSFVRRLAWTVDGAYLITPAAIWSTPNDVMTCDGDLDGVAGAAAKDNPNPNQPPIESGRVGGSYATLMFQRHRFDEPWKVLGGLEKVSSWWTLALAFWGNNLYCLSHFLSLFVDQ